MSDAKYVGDPICRQCATQEQGSLPLPETCVCTETPRAVEVTAVIERLTAAAGDFNRPVNIRAIDVVARHRPTGNNADAWAAWFFEYAGYGASYMGVQIAEAMDDLAAQSALLDRLQETRMMLIGVDQAVCVGGRFDGWMMWRHPDGGWVSLRKLTVERPSTALDAALATAGGHGDV